MVIFQLGQAFLSNDTGEECRKHHLESEKLYSKFWESQCRIFQTLVLGTLFS